MMTNTDDPFATRGEGEAMIVDDRNFVELIKDAWGAYNYEDGAGWDWVSRLADALEEAVERIAELEAERDRALEGVADQRRGIARRMGDIAALEVENLDLEARIAEAAELHQRFAVVPGDSFCKTCQRVEDFWPCETAVALGLSEEESDD